MNPNKKNVYLHGTAIWPVAVGACALLFCGGEFIRTSRVVKIYESSAEMLRFETMNSNYFVEMNPSPVAAVSPIPMGMMAA